MSKLIEDFPPLFRLTSVEIAASIASDITPGESVLLRMPGGDETSCVTVPYTGKGDISLYRIGKETDGAGGLFSDVKYLMVRDPPQSQADSSQDPIVTYPDSTIHAFSPADVSTLVRHGIGSQDPADYYVCRTYNKARCLILGLAQLEAQLEADSGSALPAHMLVTTNQKDPTTSSVVMDCTQRCDGWGVDLTPSCATEGPGPTQRSVFLCKGQRSKLFAFIPVRDSTQSACRSHKTPFGHSSHSEQSFKCPSRRPC